MADAKKIVLNDVDWMRVRMLTAEGSTIHILTEEGPFEFQFATEQEARNALEQYFDPRRRAPN